MTVGLAGALVAFVAWSSYRGDREYLVVDPAQVPSEALQVSSDRIAFPTAHRQRILLPGGDEKAVASVLRITHRLHYGQFVWAERGVPPGKSWVRVDLGKQVANTLFHRSS